MSGARASARAEEQPVDEPFTSLAAELNRIDFTGTIWFGATAIASTVPLAILLASGWRPGDLSPILAAVWWLGAVATASGIAALAWAGCPVLGFSMTEADRQKSLCIRLGTLLYIAGTIVAGAAILLSAPPG